MTDEEAVKAAIPDAELYGWSHGKVRIESPSIGIVSSMCYLGTRDKRREDAWKSARKHTIVVIWEARKLLEDLSNSREYNLYIGDDSTYGKQLCDWLVRNASL